METVKLPPRPDDVSKVSAERVIGRSFRDMRAMAISVVSRSPYFTLCEVVKPFFHVM
jgi:hypothetical protein